MFAKQPRYFVLFLLTFLLTLPLAIFSGCQNSDDSGSSNPNNGTKTDQAPANSLELVFTYGSEKEAWVKEVTQKFNQSNTKISNGKTIFVRAISMGSGDCINEIVTGQRQTHIVSPASAAFIKLGNAQTQIKTNKDLVTSTETLMLSPVVIAMWKPMAEALGSGKKALGWADILTLAQNPQGWAAYGHPEWGQFKFGHTHPEYSNSGLISLFAEVYAATGKTNNLTLADVEKPATAQYLNGIEQSVVHYGTSTGFFSTKMLANGPQYLSAAVLYENNVIDSYAQNNLPFPLVAIYPKEGTFWSDHPIGIVNKEWVTKDHQEAAQIYIKYLLAKPQQERALSYGFHPGDASIPIAAPLDTAHGIDPTEPKTVLEVPPAEVIDRIIKLWHENKKSSDIILVFDTSGSMQEEERMPNAKLGANQLINSLDSKDTLSILPFNNVYAWSGKDLVMEKDRQTALNNIQGLFPSGGTALYSSIDASYQYMLQNRKPGKISAIIVLTDGEDTDSKIALNTLLNNIRSDNEKKDIRVFTIAYGQSAKDDILKTIADTTQAKSYKGTPQNIQSVFKEISTFF